MAIAIAAVGNQRYTCELVIRRFACIALQRLCARDCASIPPVNRAVQCWLGGHVPPTRVGGARGRMKRGRGGRRGQQGRGGDGG